MENTLETRQINSETLTDREILANIWFSPRLVFRFVHEHKYDKYLYLLLFFAGIARAFDRAELKSTGDDSSLFGVIAMSVLLGGFLGWIWFWIYSALISWTGDWLGGNASTYSILRVVSYAMIPSIVALVFLIPQILVYGNGVFKSDGDLTSAGFIPDMWVYSSFVLEFILGIWTLVLCVIGISEIQKFSIGKAILNLLLPGLFFLAVVLLFVGVFSVLF